MSRGFIAALAGIAITLFAWYGPWAWPAWPAFTTIDLVFGSNTAFADLPLATRAATITMLIIVNSMFWAAVVWIAMRAMRTRSNESTRKRAPAVRKV
jgi:hypothetical protein